LKSEGTKNGFWKKKKKNGGLINRSFLTIHPHFRMEDSDLDIIRQAIFLYGFIEFIEFIYLFIEFVQCIYFPILSY